MKSLRTRLGLFALETYRRLLARPQFFEFNRFVLRAALSGLGVLNYEDSRVSGEDAFLANFAKQRANPVVFDIGANIGAYSRRVLTHMPNAKVWAFEPHPQNFERLSEAAEQSGFHAVAAGCGSAPGRIEIFDYAARDGSSHASLYRDVLTRLHGADAVVSHEVGIVTLDEFLTENAIERIDLLKIDTEGHELEVLRGTEQALSRRQVGTIQFEFNEMNVESRVFFKDIAELLVDFSLYRMLPDGLLPLKKYTPLMWEIFAYQNIVAVLRDESRRT